MKKMFRAAACLLSAAMMAAALTACGGGSESTDGGAAASGGNNGGTVVLTYAEVNSIDSLDGKVGTFFKDKVAELTGGSVVIDIQASGVLGTEADILDGMTTNSGTVDLCRISIFDLNNYGCSLSSLTGVPFTFEDRDHYWVFTEGDLAQQMLAEPSEKGLGIKGLYFMEEGFRNYFFVNEVKDLADLTGRKIRVSSDPILTGTTELLGASATVIPFNELYSSLQSGVVDGGDQPTALYESNAFNEVAPWLMKDQHTLSASEVVMSEDSMSKLTDEQMSALMEAGKAASEYCKEISAQEESESEERLKGKGVTIIEVPDKAPWRAACESIISEYTSGLESEYQQILDFAK